MTDPKADIGSHTSGVFPENNIIMSYIIWKIVGRGRWRTEKCYSAGWFGYGPQENTVEHAAQIFHHITDAYWQ